LLSPFIFRHTIRNTLPIHSFENSEQFAEGVDHESQTRTAVVDKLRACSYPVASSAAAESISSLGRFALAASVSAQAINIRRLFHGLAFGAAVLAGCSEARADGVGALLGFCRGHFVSPDFGQQRLATAAS
jgi:hypothetical protein